MMCLCTWQNNFNNFIVVLCTNFFAKFGLLLLLIFVFPRYFHFQWHIRSKWRYMFLVRINDKQCQNKKTTSPLVSFAKVKFIWMLFLIFILMLLFWLTLNLNHFLAKYMALLTFHLSLAVHNVTLIIIDSIIFLTLNTVSSSTKKSSRGIINCYVLGVISIKGFVIFNECFMLQLLLKDLLISVQID